MLGRRVVGIGSVGLGVFLLLVGIPMNVTSTGTIIMNPALFPMVAAWLMIGLGAIQILVGGPELALPPLSEPLRFAIIAGLTLGAAMLFEPLGYLIVAIGLMAVVVAMIYERRLIWVATSVLAVPVGIWLFFEHLLERPLP